MPTGRGSSTEQARDVHQSSFPRTASRGIKVCWRNRAELALLIMLVFPASVFADPAPRGPPLSYLQSFGERAAAINKLLWFLIAVSVTVIIASIVLLLGGIFRGHMRTADSLPGVVPLMLTGSGRIWLAVGVPITVLVLFASSVWTVVTLADVSFPPSGGKHLKLQITGHQWWWEARYLSDDPSRDFRTANEIHIPTGEPIEVELVTSDVIHSFWVPKLNGKTDLIPGQRNVTWFAADKPGIYRGQCTEYCGRQHSHMALEVIAEAPDDFRAWWDHQLESAPPPETADAENALGSFILKCGICHSVRGTPAGGAIGPDLSHLMTRRTIAAGTLLNTIGGLSAWIADPQHVKPGNLMPAPEISGAELSRIRAFLGTLK
jgi:cytochrome c oxidase subunit II